MELKNIEKIVCQVLKLDPILFHSECRRKDIVKAKHIYSYIANNLNIYKLRIIGDHIKRSHSSVIHSCTTISNELTYDKKLNLEIEKIKSKVKANQFDQTH